jgi:hypothetical protein
VGCSNTKAYTAHESYHKYRAEYAGIFPGRHAKYLVGTQVCFGPDNNAEGRSLHLYDLKNRHVGIVVGETTVSLCHLRLETQPASQKCGPLPDICPPPILYATVIHTNSLTIWGCDCTTSLVSSPKESAAY